MMPRITGTPPSKYHNHIYTEQERAKRIKGWNKAVRCAYHWAEDEE